MKAIGYMRVSSAEQVDGQSLEAQREAIQRLCEYEKYEIEAVYADEGISARDTKRRRQLERAVAHAGQVKGVLVAYSFSRLFRSAGHAEGVIEKLHGSGACVRCCVDPIDTTTAMGRAMVGIISVIARLESELIGERVKSTNTLTKKKLGYRTQGHQPFGIVVPGKGKQRQVRVEEAATLRLIERLALKGFTTQQIADELNSRGIPTRNKGRGYKRECAGIWRRQLVLTIIKRHRPELIKHRASKYRSRAEGRAKDIERGILYPSEKHKNITHNGSVGRADASDLHGVSAGNARDNGVAPAGESNGQVAGGRADDATYQA